MQYVRLQENWSTENGVYGVVTSTGALNIRSGAGVGHAPVGSYPSGARVLIYEQVSVSGQKWGRTDKGWVCMDYIRLEEAAVPETTEPEVPETTVPPTEDPTEPPEQEVIATGSVTASALNIRAIPSTSGAVVGSYRKGEQVAILEQKQVNGTAWGRTEKGWICLAYVKLDAPDASETGTKVVITADVLCIRKGPGTGNAVIGTYKRGQTVIILETCKLSTTLWGRTDLGWICMDYVKAK